MIKKWDSEECGTWPLFNLFVFESDPNIAYYITITASFVHGFDQWYVFEEQSGPLLYEGNIEQELNVSLLKYFAKNTKSWFTPQEANLLKKQRNKGVVRI